MMTKKFVFILVFSFFVISSARADIINPNNFHKNKHNSVIKPDNQVKNNDLNEKKTVVTLKREPCPKYRIFYLFKRNYNCVKSN